MAITTPNSSTCRKVNSTASILMLSSLFWLVVNTFFSRQCLGIVILLSFQTFFLYPLMDMVRDKSTKQPATNGHPWFTPQNYLLRQAVVSTATVMLPVAALHKFGICLIYVRLLINFYICTIYDPICCGFPSLVLGKKSSKCRPEDHTQSNFKPTF